MKTAILLITAMVGGGIAPAFGGMVIQSHQADGRCRSGDMPQSFRARVDDQAAHNDESQCGHRSVGTSGDSKKEQSGTGRSLRVAALDTGPLAAISGADGGTEVRGGLEEVLVTAQKYRERAFDVPISMTVMGGAELQRLAITDLNDLQFLVPGMFVENTGGVSLRITLQGIGNLFGQKALVGTYLDDADVTSEAVYGLDLDTYDLERVEVLKGPQGTLYGAGSLGGTIRYITNKPALSQFQLAGNVTAMFDQYGAPGDRIQAVVNAPLVTDVLGLRIAVNLDHEGGWIDQPAANQRNVNSDNITDVRMSGRWKPTPDLVIDAMEVIHRAALGPFTGASESGIYTQYFNLLTTPSTDDNYNVSNLRVEWDPGDITVVNSATYFKHTIASFDWGQSLQYTQPPSPKFNYYYTDSPTVDENWSDELRLSGDGSGRVHWTVGAFYKRIDSDILPFDYYFGLPGPPGTPLPQPFSYSSDVLSKSTSVFGDANVQIIDNLVVGGGVRYFRDKESGLLAGDAQGEEQTFSSVDPRVYLRYGVSRNVNIYASAGKGFRSGGFNGFGNPEYRPEHVWTYEIGSKMKLWDDHMSVNSDVFLSNYADYVVFGFLPDSPVGTSSNAGDARLKGVETDVAWSPTDRLRFGLSGDYINARFVHINVIGSAYNEGDPLDLVPRYQITGSAERDFSWLGRAAFARVDYTQRARETFRNRGNGPWYYSQSNYMYLLSVHAGITWTRNLQMGFFVQNLLNDRGYTGADVVEDFAALQEPRTFGVSFSVKFE